MMTMAIQIELVRAGPDGRPHHRYGNHRPDIEKLVGLGGQIFGKLPATFPETDPDGRPAFMAIPKPSLDLSSPEMHVTPKCGAGRRPRHSHD